MSTVSSPVPSANPTTATAAATDATQPPSSESLTTCRYPSKKCWNTRALKRNGEMHNLCELHRQKANKNQRRLELKRKVSKKAAASAKRARKSRAAAKGRAGTVRVGKIQQHVGAATTVTNAARTLQRQQPKAAPKLAAPSIVVIPSAPLTAPPGFFTDLMLSEPPLLTKQLEPTQVQHASGLGWPVATTQHPHVLLHSQLHVAPQLYHPAPLAFEVDEFFDADTDVDSLVAYLDAHPYATSSLVLTAPSSSIGGGSSPIDVCDGLDAIAAVSDFRWHPVVMASAAESFQDASNDELRLHHR